MARGSNALLLAELEKLRSALGKLDVELGRVQSRLTVVEGRLSQSTEHRQMSVARDPGKRVH